MFSHHGVNRTYWHNLKLASLLSLVAGIVNVTGVLSVKILTTNVTGHFAYFSEEFAVKNYTVAFVYLLFILCFLGGAFISGILIEMVSILKPEFSVVIPMVIEMIILGASCFCQEPSVHLQIFAGILLFAMGLQNALVTKVSNSVVRTTHLTGLFTDLGIELSQLFYLGDSEQRRQTTRSIWLKVAIIGCFFGGCVGGAFLFHIIATRTLLVATFILLTALLYDRSLSGNNHKQFDTFL